MQEEVAPPGDGLVDEARFGARGVRFACDGIRLDLVEGGDQTTGLVAQRIVQTLPRGEV